MQQVVHKESRKVVNYLHHLMTWSRFVKESRRKSKHFHDLLRFKQMKKIQTFFSFTSTAFCHIVLFFCLHFCILSHFEIIKCSVKTMTATSVYFLLKYNQKKQNLKSAFWEPEFEHANQYTGLPNGLDMSLFLITLTSFPTNQLSSYVTYITCIHSYRTYSTLISYSFFNQTPPNNTFSHPLSVCSFKVSAHHIL